MSLQTARLALGGMGIVVAVAAAIAPSSTPIVRVDPITHQQQMKQAEVQQRFRQAIVMLHAKQYEHAATALHRVLTLAPRMPEAHVNLGYALIGLERADEAQRAFSSAIDLRPQQANAYYGLALAAEMRKDYETALGGMRSYLHLSPADDPWRTRARSAIWEWEGKLGRH